MAKKKEPVSSFQLDKTTLFWCAIGLLLVTMFIVTFFSSKPATDEVKLVIDYGDGRARKFISQYRPGSRAWDMLQQANAIYGIPLKVENHFLPIAIGDKENGQEGKEWNFYLNDRRSEVHPFESMLEGGEVILFKFE